MTGVASFASLPRPVLHYITAREQFPGREEERRQALLNKVAEAARAGVSMVQVREKDLGGRELEQLSRSLRSAFVEAQTGPGFFVINSRPDIALSVAADGVHLPSDGLSVSQVRKIWSAAGFGRPALVGVSCHTLPEVAKAAEDGADYVVFGPVFSKGTTPGIGLKTLADACRHRIPVLALGGVTLENAPACIAAGAAGVAGIRLFQDNDVAEVVLRLRG
ncbi:MAG: thiamine phosphate synthase [Acidobacteriales bacterium]|nr:thiamine phosphate synthase [Terriglobales bacterium]